MGDSLGDRMKGYERIQSLQAMRRTPLIIRLDGRAFHTFSQGLTKPFDPVLMDTMVAAAKVVAHEAQGFKLGYTQSDEVTLCLTDYDKLETQPWFGYDMFKLVSISAAVMTEAFNDLYPEKAKIKLHHPVFDSRAFSIPEDEVTNMFLWRAKDWERNSLSMYCRNFFSHNELKGKSRQEQHEMLHSIGKNWAEDLALREKNGTFIFRGGEEGFIHSDAYCARYSQINILVESTGVHTRA